ncbi:MAG: seg [candidate division WWE3 bacterium GW2011_GWC1_47_10]|uniref:Ferredoxin n=1 Tax=candidate division WWE3 bacterium GW2011_GWC1_47_10 TaxID=1619122 RepID=A0A0G1T9B1_UNCKA|nr:MAG: seg [candidate division WWE3 bacterium GW2011_GWC1_47_10]
MKNEAPRKRKVHKIVVDRNACIGAATCIIVAPDAFDLDDKNIAIVKPGALDLDDDTLLMAAQSCPTAAIRLCVAKSLPAW